MDSGDRGESKCKINLLLFRDLFKTMNVFCLLADALLNSLLLKEYVENIMFFLMYLWYTFLYLHIFLTSWLHVSQMPFFSNQTLAT